MKEVSQKNWWKRKTVGQKVMFIIAVILFLICSALMLILMNLRETGQNELADIIYGKDVANGWIRVGQELASSTISWVLTVVIIFISFILIFVSNFITHLFDNKSRKANTISSLIRSLIKYVVIIAAICFILIAWGVDVAGVLAGVGVLTLIIGLGCQTLIQDIISGLFIVFDDYFAVGDTVIIDGFRGTITEVGLKTTKLEDFGGNIKSISNSSINTVVNMSRLRSVVSVTLSVSYNEDVEHVEGLIVKEINLMKEKIPSIIEGPWYKGIDNVSASSIDFLVLAFVKEADRFQVTRDMKREFYLLFKNNNIQIPYNQVTVNPEDSKIRDKASETDKEYSLHAIREQRGLVVKEKPKKKTNKMVDKVKKSLEKTREEME